MVDMRFDARVAVITGSGRGLGFEYARLLASRGAHVVINDNGSTLDGSGADQSIAAEAVRRIEAEGGEAIACTASVATPEGGRAIVESALDRWGRIDVLIHNAGNTRFDDFATIETEAFRSVVDVHLLGAFHVTHAAFPHMREAGYGRVVLTGSIGGLYTMPQTVGYAVSKSGMIGLNNVIAIEGADRDVKSNIILPGAVTRMAEGLDISQYPPMGPDMVAPMVGYLVHEDCAVTGELYVSVAGRLARAYVTETRGVWRPEWSIESVAEEIGAIRDPAEAWTFHPAENGFAEHLTKSFAMARGAN
ncbi:SDR family NAD(P)-dependent oxidoreductase [Novosphingobium sp. PS1R-30]|uniref:SDR family NAD(P)-dependent oxidoreductase n=1 Tax=Novosphingobium anseongense TaxID=3133436 RepID=A0ABU8RPZ1_9SPHN